MPTKPYAFTYLTLRVRTVDRIGMEWDDVAGGARGGGDASYDSLVKLYTTVARVLRGIHMVKVPFYSEGRNSPRTAEGDLFSRWMFFF